MQISFEKIKEELQRIERGIKKLRFFQFIDLAHFWRIVTKKEKVIFLSFIALIMVGLTTDLVHIYIVHTISVPEHGGTYTEGLIGQPRFINPLLAQSQTDKDLARLIYSGLYKYDDQGHLVPDLASGDAQISKDQRQFTIKLKPDLKWHDGQTLNADDVVFTIETIKDPAYKSPLQKNWQNTTIKKIDDLTIQINISDVSAPFLTNLNLGILPKHIWQNTSPDNFGLSNYNLEPVGSGPYFAKQISKAVDGSITSYSFSSYANYWGGQPLIDQFVFKFFTSASDALDALHSKEIDGFGFIPFNEKVYVDQHTTLSVEKLPLYAYQAVFFNTNKNPKVLGDAAVRTALTEATDRAEIINSVFNGLAGPDYGPILPEQLGYDPDVQKINPFNIQAANKLLDKDGWVKDPATGFRSKAKTPLAFTITTNDFVLNVKSAQIIAAEWKKVGANITINSVSTQDLEKNYIHSRNYDALLFAESTGFDSDLFVFWHSSQSNDPGLNLSEYKNTTADRLISDARNTFNPQMRTQKYAAVQPIIVTDAPAVFLTQSDFVYELTNKLKGPQFNQLANPEDRFYDVSHWYISTKRVLKK